MKQNKIRQSGWTTSTLLSLGPTQGFIRPECRLAQAGRSMVEIIGVLAVAGVLGIGGIMGYSYGMNKYHANEAIYDANMRMIDVATYVMRGVQIDELDSAWSESKSGYDIELFHDSDSEPSLIIKQVPTGICKEILKSTPDTQDIFVGSENADGMDGSWYLGDNEHICDNGMCVECTKDSHCPSDEPNCNPNTNCVRLVMVNPMGLLVC